ncbi:hypothetical protein MVEN_02408900 [Mycena venus]|uniref:Uncharacterized protein n=1 Tax=Mycena venus TaxID=2733690 RepID=A0A8H7CDY8_9AGAR|nr:hypothetical protein MVEN_02408900 [Mycena venus]
MFSAIVFVSAAFLTLTSATPLAATTCSPPAASNLSFGSILSDKGPIEPAGPAELGVPDIISTAFPPPVFWLPPAAVGPWTLVKSGSQYLIRHAQFPGKFLTSILSAGDLELNDGPVSDAQKWNITCTTCPSNGLTTDCTFLNNPFPNTQFNSENCILNDRLLELGNDTNSGEKSTFVISTIFDFRFELDGRGMKTTQGNKQGE